MEQLQRDDKRMDKTQTVEDRGREQETRGREKLPDVGTADSAGKKQ